jgi:hypothetical protein
MASLASARFVRSVGMSKRLAHNRILKTTLLILMASYARFAADIIPIWSRGFLRLGLFLCGSLCSIGRGRTSARYSCQGEKENKKKGNALVFEGT